MLKCPNCGSTNICKEYYLGSQTGDYECGGCEESGPRMYFEESEDNDPEQVEEHLQGRFGSAK